MKERLRAAAVEAAARGAWVPALVLAVHLVLRWGLGTYDRYPSTDVPMHLVGGWAIAFFGERALDACARHAVVLAPDRILRAALVFQWTATAAVFWEFVEFCGDALGVTHAQESVADTMLDLALGLVGGVVYLAFGPRPRAARS